ncbi:unnamed protein product [Arabidopsis halleri]
MLITFGRRSGVSSSSPPTLVVEGVFGSPNRDSWLTKSGIISADLRVSIRNR